MKKIGKKMKVEIKIGRKQIFLIGGILVVLFLTGISLAFNYPANDPSEMGHSADEISKRCVTADTTDGILYKHLNLSIDGENICEGVQGCEIFVYNDEHPGGSYWANRLNFPGQGITNYKQEPNGVFFIYSGIAAYDNGDSSGFDIVTSRSNSGSASGKSCVVTDYHSSASEVDSKDNLFLVASHNVNWACFVSVCRIGP